MAAAAAKYVAPQLVRNSEGFALLNGKPVDGKALGMDPIDINGAGGFGCRLPHLVELISERGTHGLERLLIKFDGLAGLAQKLNTDLARGIPGTDEDKNARRHVFGVNKMPEVEPKTLLQLMWEALQDPILIVLMVAATVSLVLGAIPSISDHPEVGELCCMKGEKRMRVRRKEGGGGKSQFIFF